MDVRFYRSLFYHTINSKDMSKNRNDYSQSMRLIIVGVSLFSSFCFSLLIFSFIDSIFFGNELSSFLANRYFRFMIGFILIPIFGGGAFIMYWATRSNFTFMNAFDEKLTLTNASNTDVYSASKTELDLKEYIDADDSFARLYKRFNGYLRGISGSGGFGTNHALDLNSQISGNTIKLITQVGLGLMSFILVWLCIVSYISNVYQTNFTEVLKLARIAHPDLTFTVIGLLVVALLIFVYIFIRQLIENVLVPIMNLGDSVLSTEKTDPWKNNYPNFMSKKYYEINVSWRSFSYPIFFVCSTLPFVIGLILLNSNLLICGGVCLFIGFVLKRFDDRKLVWFRFVDKKSFELGTGFKAITISIFDLKEVLVHYQSIKNNSFLYPSQSSFMRSAVNKMVNTLMDSPDLIPSTIIFQTKSGNNYSIPIRNLMCNDILIHSHEIEFFFAFWLKANGFVFELVESDEDAGNWRAFFV